MARSLESERADARFHDPYAHVLAGQRGQDLMRFLPWGTWIGWMVVVRTCIFDELILQMLQQEGVETVLNLGAGLDTRPYRLDLPASLRWIEVDLPDILTDKEEKLAGAQPGCALERVKLDLADEQARRQLFCQLHAQAGHLLVMSEGVLLYLSVRQVASLAADLHGLASSCWWLTDHISPLALRLGQLMWDSSLAGTSRMQFAPAEGEHFFTGRGWRVVHCRSAWEEAVRLQRTMPWDWYLHWMTLLHPWALEATYRNLITYLLLQHHQRA
jgi:methyltransferase (TIGR00027 family)